MLNIGFVGGLAFAFFILFRWAFRNLPQERFQVMATIPMAKQADGGWQGLNLTYYGFFSASAYVAAMTALFILLGALSISRPVILCVAAAILLICVPAARLVARMVEKKAYTFSVGGAAFIGILVAPWIFYGLETFGPGPQGFVLPGITALATAYALGEGLGRLACISFGCCYGRPMHEIPHWVQRLIGFRAFVFMGKTKKAAYASQLDGKKLFPIQAVTATLYTGISLLGMFLYLEGRYAWAFCLTMIVTQLWRFISEFLRADFRGHQSISAYQHMALLAIPYAGLIAYLFPNAPLYSATLATGLALLWDPVVVTVCGGVWFAIFLYTGRSQVTGATLNIYVKKQNI